jgi:hypothetical protein
VERRPRHQNRDETAMKTAGAKAGCDRFADASGCLVAEDVCCQDIFAAGASTLSHRSAVATRVAPTARCCASRCGWRPRLRSNLSSAAVIGLEVSRGHLASRREWWMCRTAEMRRFWTFHASPRNGELRPWLSSQDEATSSRCFLHVLNQVISAADRLWKNLLSSAT